MSKKKDCVWGAFASPAGTAKAMAALKKAGVKNVCLFSPLDPKEANIPTSEQKSGIGRFTALGALLGVVFGLIFSVGTAIVYPIETGGLPVLSLPAIAIITFDFMLLGAILATMFGFFYCALWASRVKPLGQAMRGGCFGLRVEGERAMLDAAADVLKKSGAKQVGKLAAGACVGLSMMILIPALALGFSWSRDMVEQPVRKSQEAAVRFPASLVPRHAPPQEPATKDEAAWLENPTPLSEASFKRGRQLYETFCTICHGETGKGDGVMAERIGEFPDFSKPEFLEQPDGCIYFVITNGANFEEEVFRPRETAVAADVQGGGEIIWDETPGEIVWDAPSEDEGGHAHDDGALMLEDDHAHKPEDEHAHDERADHHDDGHTHGEPVLSGPRHDEGHDDGHDHEHAPQMAMAADDGHDHDHGGGDDGHDDHAHDAPQCGAGHSHDGGGHGHDEGAGGDGHDDSGGHAHGSGKKHFMPPHRDAISPIGRWHIVNYIRYELGQ